MLRTEQFGWSSSGETPLVPLMSICLVSTMTSQKWRLADEGNRTRSQLLHPALCRLQQDILGSWRLLSVRNGDWGTVIRAGDSPPLYLMLPVRWHSLGRRDNKEQKVPFHTGGTRCFQGYHDQVQARHAVRMQRAGCSCVHPGQQAGRALQITAWTQAFWVLSEQPKRSWRQSQSWGKGHRVKYSVKDSKPSPCQMSNKPCSGPSVQKNFKRLRGSQGLGNLHGVFTISKAQRRSKSNILGSKFKTCLGVKK